MAARDPGGEKHVRGYFLCHARRTKRFTLSLWDGRASSVVREKILRNKPSLLCSDYVNERCDVTRNPGAEKRANSPGHFFFSRVFLRSRSTD